MEDQALMELLLEHQVAEQSHLQAFLDQEDAELKSREKLVRGLAYLIDPLTAELVVRQHPGGQEVQRFKLSQDYQYTPEHYRSWAKEIFLMDPQDRSVHHRFGRALDTPYGLVASHLYTYDYHNAQLQTPYLALSRQALYGGMAKQAHQAGPFDLFISKDQRWLCISDRGAGQVNVFSTTPLKSLGSVSIRQPGSQLALNIAIDEANQQAYITDNQSAGLYVLNFESMQLTQQWLGLGNLGNLVIAPDNLHLFLLSMAPDVGLHYLSMGSLDTSLSVKGELFCDLDLAPCDLLSLDPEGKWLMMMSAHSEPEPQTPLITVINLEQVKATRRFTIKGGQAPLQLAQAFQNPMDYQRKSLESRVLEAGLITAEALLELQTPPEPEPPDVSETQAVDTRDVLQNDPESDTLNLTPKKSAPISLNAEMTELIVDILLNTLESQTHESLKESTELRAALQEPADQARQELESFDSTIVQAEKIYQKHDLKTVVLREAVLKAWEVRRSSEGEVTPPARCPNCEARLESWDCESCGYELDSPERMHKNRSNSATATSNLPHGHFVLPDPQGLRLLQLNPFKYIAWNLDPDKVPAQYPIDLIWLPNENLLVTDKDGNAVVEVSLRGEEFWRFDTQKSYAHLLHEPVKATYFIPENKGERHYLIVDQGNHRVLEVNNQSEIIREFGAQGEPGSDSHLLHSPHDVQFTHEQTYLVADTGNDRVVEYQLSGEVARVFGPELGLKSPTCMQRLLNQHTLIVDAGNYRLLELDASGQVVNECLYFNSTIDPAFHIVSPIRMIRLFNSDVLVMDEDKLIQVNLRTRQLVWFSKIENLAFQPKVDAPELVVDENGVEKLVYKVLDHGNLRPVRLSQKINFKRMQQLITARLKMEAQSEVGGAKDNKTTQLQALIEERKLQQKSSLRRRLTEDSIQPSQIFQQEGADLQKMRYYLIDRNHNAVIRLNRKGEVKWSYGFEMGQNMLRPHHLSETRTSLLIGDTSNNRIVEISKAEHEILREIKLDRGIPLAGPRSAKRIEDDQTLIADTRGKRLLIVDLSGQIVWEYANSSEVKSPQYAEALGNGHILYVDAMLNTIREIDREGQTHWSYGSRLKGTGPNQLFAPEFATRLANGHTLIADTRNNRVLEVDATGKEVWSYASDQVAKRLILNPFYVERLDNGNTRIAYNNSRELIEVSASGERLWSYKMGNDVFLQPVTGSTHGLKQAVEELSPYYNPIEKRLIRSAGNRKTQGVEAHICFMENVQMKSVRASLMLMLIERFGTVLKTFPSPEELLASKFGKDLIIALILDPGQDLETVNQQLGNLAEVESTRLIPLSFEEEVKEKPEVSTGV